MHPEQLLAVAREAAHAGASVLRREFGRGGLEVREKATNDFVTSADKASEQAILEVIRRRCPGHAILAEEAGWESGPEADYRWVVDPLDGTNNFIQGLPIYCVSVACCRGDEPVAGVVLEPERDGEMVATRGGGAFWNGRRIRVSERPRLEGAFLATGYPFRAHAALDLYLDAFREVFLAARAIRRCGAAALDLAYTAAGVFDGFFEFRLSPWDLAAGVLLVEEAGGQVTDLDGGRSYFRGGNVVAGGAAVQGELRARIAAHASEADLDREDPATGAELTAEVVP